ncbi:MAG: TrmH family RNA methyltransferase [Gammaproteobacteria bacterium]
MAPSSSKQAQRRRHNALQRYARERQRNVLASPGPQTFVLVLDHLKAGFNVAKIFRSAEAFGASEVHLINVAPFDPAPAKGAFRKVPARFHEDFQTCFAELTARGYVFFALDASCARHSPTTPLPRKSAFILGNEGLGLCFSRADYPAVQCLAIPLAGHTESLNVSVAASIIMYEYNRQYPLTLGSDT